MTVRNVAALLLMSITASALEVPLTVEEPIGAERKREVVSGGIPLPEGKYKDAAAFSLFDGATEVPVQISPIVKFPDGSLHWALVSFPVEAAAKSKKTYTLKDAPGKAAPKNPVVVKEDGDVVEVSNGLVSFSVNKASFNGFESIKAGGKEVFKSPKAIILANGKGGPAKPTHFDFVYKGPILTTLYVKCPIGDQKTPTSAMSITLRAGESAIFIDHNLRNGGIGVKGTDVTSPAFCLGTTGELKAGASVKPPSPRPSFGWHEFSGTADLLLFFRHGGPAHQGGKDLALAYNASVKDGELVVDLSMVKDKPTKLEEGEHKITEIALVFSKAFSPEALLAPLHALAPCSYYAEHDGMGVGRGFGSLADETETYKAASWKKYDDPKKMPRMNPAPDLWFNWLDVHATSEGDQIQGMIFGYLRTGQRGYLDQATAWQRYYRAYYMYRTDDFIYGKEGRRGGLEKFGGGRTCNGGCHTYGVGIFNYALLSGNVDALEAAFDLAEQCNATAGSYSNTKPGAGLGYWGSRGFVRNYLAVARAADVARNKDWNDRVIHFINCAAKAADRDQRGFINHGYVSQNAKQSIADQTKQGTMPEAVEMAEKEGVTIEGAVKHPKWGSWPLKEFGSWPEAMESEGHVIAYEALASATDPVAQLAADDAMDLAIVKSELGLYYVFDPVQKAVYYYMYIDYPIPGHSPLWKGGKWKERIPKWGSDSWYTKWWPNPMAAGYRLTGDKRMLERCVETLWWGLSRNYINPPEVPEGEAPNYARIGTSTKDDWMTPTALAFGICAHPKKDEAPPAAVTDLKASATGDGKVELTWPAPADAGGGKTVKYQVKYAEMPMDDYPVDGEHWRKNWNESKVTVTYWNFAKNVVGEPAPQAAGKSEKMTLDLPAGKKIYVSIRSFDDSHNRSKMSNVAEVDVK
ncbi:MAG: hypothetical protein C0404_02650 [Verrucomicrobia bacterium]|nr:hypothetical protein [Verrucomicrobiota bacterium]